MIEINIAVDFSRTPGSRFESEGKWSGQEFLRLWLEPRFLKAQETKSKLVVNFDGAEGYATSFLDGSFGELARRYGASSVLAVLELRSTLDPFLPEEVLGYINDAK
jgi:hypothetical protein